MLDSGGVTCGGYVLSDFYLLFLFISCTSLPCLFILVLQESSGVCFLVSLLMMLLDSLLYFAIGLYLDKVTLLDSVEYFLNLLDSAFLSLYFP